ncbi:MAG: hypothetical protein HYY18_08180 [Planctomycetes bacterium]|nr:hypothetical protein [Planctomycetota bacterium]
MDEKEIEEVRATLRRLHRCDAHHMESLSVHETFKGRTLWLGMVEVFALTGHPQATKAFAWMRRSGVLDQGRRLWTVLARPPVDTARDAVRSAILEELRAKVQPVR